MEHFLNLLPGWKKKKKNRRKKFYICHEVRTRAVVITWVMQESSRPRRHCISSRNFKNDKINFFFLHFFACRVFESYLYLQNIYEWKLPSNIYGFADGTVDISTALILLTMKTEGFGELKWGLSAITQAKIRHMHTNQSKVSLCRSSAVLTKYSLNMFNEYSVNTPKQGIPSSKLKWRHIVAIEAPSKLRCGQLR